MLVNCNVQKMKSVCFLAALMAAVMASPARESAEINKRIAIAIPGGFDFPGNPGPIPTWNPKLLGPIFGGLSGGKKRLVLDGPGFGDNGIGALDGGFPFTEGITGNTPDLGDVSEFVNVIISFLSSIWERLSGGPLIDNGIQPFASRDVNMAPN